MKTLYDVTNTCQVFDPLSQITLLSKQRFFDWRQVGGTQNFSTGGCKQRAKSAAFRHVRGFVLFCFFVVPFYVISAAPLEPSTKNNHLKMGILLEFEMCRLYELACISLPPLPAAHLSGCS